MICLIKKGTIVEDSTEKIKDILIEGGRITKIADHIDIGTNDEDIEIINAENCYVIPGLIDMNCDICDPGYENREDITSVSKAAAKGGFTSITCQPKTHPVIDNKTVVSYIITKSKRLSPVNIFPYGSMTKGMENKEIAEIGEMVNAGIVAVSDGGNSVSNAFLMRNIFLYAKMFDIPVITMCEDKDVAQNGVINNGRTSTLYGLKGIPREAEEVIVSRNIILAENTGARLHISSVSTKGSAELIRLAKQKGIKITCETQPHYFTLTEEAVYGYNTFAKVKPPLRTDEDLVAIIEAIKDNTIDVISTGHCPNTIENKNVEFDRASYGLSSLETAFAVSYTALVDAGHISLSHLVNKFSSNPAKILQIKGKGCIGEGFDGDLIIFDKDESYNIKAAEFSSKSKYSPYDGFLVKGKIKHTIINGKLIDFKK